MRRVTARAPLLLAAAILISAARGSGASPAGPQADDEAATASDSRMITLQLPRVPQAGERVWLLLRTGPLKLGTVLRLTTPDGQIIDAVTPFGQSSGAGELEFPVAVPAAAIDGADLVFNVQTLDPAVPAPRAPTEDELIDIQAFIR